MATNGTVNGDPDEQGPLKVIIVGAGIGGLMAAHGLRLQGHHVSMYEQSRMSQETGAAIHVAPNFNGLLQRLGLRPRDHGSVELCGMTDFDASGQFVRSMDTRPLNAMWQHPWDLIHRAHLHSGLRELATSPDGKGKPVELNLGSRIESVDPANATATLSDGTVVRGDLLIGADGVHSVTRKFLPGGDLKPFDSDKSAFRFLIPTEQIASEPTLAPLVERKNQFLMWVAPDRRLVMYPCAGGTQMNFVAIHPSAESSVHAGGDAWQQTGSKAKLLHLFESFGEQVRTLLGLVDESKLKIWTLLDMEKMPTFINGRLAVLGDAAHPFLPRKSHDLAQGGAQAGEDAMSLAAIFPLGTSPQEVPDRLKIYEAQRYERSNSIQESTRIAGADLKQGQALDMQRFTAYNVGHDEWHSSTAALEKYLAQRDLGTARWRTPVGFGRAPGPRQPLGLHSNSREVARIREQTPETSSTLSIRFKSSRTYLQNLLPPGFSYVSPATICEATLLCNTLDSMTWLGGGGYSFVMLCLHGIQYTKRNGEKLFGTFLPILLENLADPIITGRDDLGMPKLYADIDVQHQGEEANVEISWRGAKFGSVTFKGLATEASEPPQTNGTSVEAPRRPGPPPPPPDNGQFAWRFVPAVGQPGKVDAEYPVFVPNPDPARVGRDAKVRVAQEASFEFLPGDWKSLPTLHNVTRVLAEIPQYGLVQAKHTTANGCDDLSGAYRIE